MANFKDIKAHLLSLDSDARGKLFERYCKWFLENDSSYALQLKQVWLWKDWPEKWGRDKGIDLIAETHQGKIWAIQVKAYNENNYITKEDIDTFLSESSREIISFRLLIATTNNLGPNAQEVMSGQEKPVGLCLLEQLETVEINWPHDLTKSQSLFKKEIRIPSPHQMEAIQNILLGFEKSAFGQVHMACGTGKTLVGLWVTEQLKSNTTLVLVPSIALISQLYKEWCNNCSNEFNFSPIFVCSDETVWKKEDDDDGHSQEILASLGFPVTTKLPDLIKELSFPGNKVIFATYHSSPIIKQACEQDNSLIFDLVIADEAHRCAGKAKSAFAPVADKDAIRSHRKLFMTATPKIFAEHVKKKSQEFEFAIASMDDEEKFGPVFHKLPFSAAIKQDLLTDYQVVISIVDNKTYQEYAERGRFVSINNYETDARTVASQLLIAKAIRQYDLKKIITFHNRKKSAQEFVNDFPKAINLLPECEKPNIEYLDVIFGEMLQSNRANILKKFRELNIGCSLLGNVKCLSEGVDVPALDGIAFIDPKGSEIDIVQAIGRVIRKAENNTKKIGTIIIPVFIDALSNETIALEESCFKPVAKVLRALRAHDDMLAEELDNIRLELGKRVYKKPPKLRKITIDLPIGIGVEFAEALNIKIIFEAMRTRCWLSFEGAREFVRNLGLKSESEWRLYIAGEMSYLPKLPDDIPKAPWVAYENAGWNSWGDFLGTNQIAPRFKKYRTYEEAIEFVHALELKRKEDWFLYIKNKIQGLISLPNDIPKTPDKTYRRQEYGKKWQGWRHFLGLKDQSNWDKAHKWRSYKDSQKFVRDLNLKSVKEWNQYCNKQFLDLPIKPNDIPRNPDQIYEEWDDWTLFLGSEISKFNCERSFLPFEQARALIRKLGLKNQKEWFGYCAGKFPNLPSKPLEIPSNPAKKYKKLGWINLRDWLGID